MDLITELRAKLDEVEQVARGSLGGLGGHSAHVGPGVWRYDGDRTVWYGSVAIAQDEPQGYPRNGAHIALHDPAATLRMVAAHRKILDAYEAAITWHNAHRFADAGEVTGLQTAVKALAEGYGIEP